MTRWVNEGGVRVSSAMLVFAVACAPESSAGGVATSSDGTPGDSSGTTIGESTSSGEGGGATKACHDLPAAEVAHWVEGPPIESSATSTPERIAAAGERTWDLALDLLRLTDPDDVPSVASAPTSMMLSLGLAYRRWMGTGCGDSIHELMHYPEQGESLHETLGASIGELESRSLPGDPDTDPVVVSLRSSIWELDGSAGGELEGDPDYGATRNAVTVTSDSLPAIREVINCVIEAQSEGLLVDFLPPNVPDIHSASFDNDVAFLQAPWESALTPGISVQFTDDAGAKTSIDAMEGAMQLVGYSDDDDMTVVDLSLRQSSLAVAFMLPKRPTHPRLRDLVESLTAEQLRAAIASATVVYADVTLPIVRIPSVTIDYFPIFGFECNPEVELRRVFHGATVEIDEKGIKAAAATVSEGGFDTSGDSAAEVTVVLDHPFAFFVHDRVTGYVLYSGRFAG
jgi:serpin B